MSKNKSESRNENKDMEEMSEFSSLVSIFYQPRKTFEALRKKPKFMLAALVIIIGVGIFNAIAIQKFGLEKIVRAGIEKATESQKLPRDQKEQLVKDQTSPLSQTVNYFAPPISVVVISLIGGLIYMLVANALGGTAKYVHGLSAWFYSGLPPSVLIISTNILMLILTSADELDPTTVQNGLLNLNLSVFVDAQIMPVWAALLSSVDLIVFWAWALAATGLQILAKISSKKAWAIVLSLGLTGVAFKVIGTFMS